MDHFIVNHGMRFFYTWLIFIILAGVLLGISKINEIKSHEYVVTSSCGHHYYIDDYNIEDGSIVFYVDGVQYHFSDYSVMEIK